MSECVSCSKDPLRDFPGGPVVRVREIFLEEITSYMSCEEQIDVGRSGEGFSQAEKTACTEI